MKKPKYEKKLDFFTETLIVFTGFYVLKQIGIMSYFLGALTLIFIFYDLFAKYWIVNYMIKRQNEM